MFNKRIKELQKENDSLHIEASRARLREMEEQFDKATYRKSISENVELKKQIELLNFKVETLEYQNKIYKDILEVK